MKEKNAVFPIVRKRKNGKMMGGCCIMKISLIGSTLLPVLGVDVPLKFTWEFYVRQQHVHVY